MVRQGSSAKFRILKNFKEQNPIPIFDFGIRLQSETEKCGRTSPHWTGGSAAP